MRLKRMIRARSAQALVFFTTAVGAIVTIASLVDCSSDEDTSVTIVRDCDVAKLNTAVPAEATVKLFVATINDTLTRGKELQTRYKDVCNAMNREMGEAEGADIRAACNKVAARVAKANGQTPVPEGGLPSSVTPWVVISWDQRCFENAAATAECLNQCSGGPGCDPLGKCAKPAGACGASCEGTCETAGTDLPCVGECKGACAMLAPPPPDSGAEPFIPQNCTAECSGTCKLPTWTGRCETACNTSFLGFCGGTCTGTCNDSPIGTPNPFDAGAEGGTPDAGPAPTGSDGNCPGVCKGQCSAKASGTCKSPCAGAFSGGTCAGPGNCIGSCRTASTGCTSTCTGSCTSKATTACAGTCRGKCGAGLSSANCEGPLSCEANDECKGTCALRGALAAKCPAIKTAEVRIAGDYEVYDAVNRHIGEFATLTNELLVVRAALERIADRTQGDFKAIGLVSERGFKCVDGAIVAATEARTLLATSLSASTVIKGQKF